MVILLQYLGLIFGLHRIEHVGQFIGSQDAFLNEKPCQGLQAHRDEAVFEGNAPSVPVV
jgi:hypothetical protein